MKQLLTILLLCVSLVSFSQSDSIWQTLGDKNFISLYDGSMIIGNEVILEEPFLGRNYFSVDGQKFEWQTVQFFQNEYGFFANPRPMLLTKEFIPCVSQGRINLFELDRESYTPSYDPNFGVTNNYNRTINNYYNKGLDNLRKANYANLSIDLSDSPEAMQHLQRFRKQSNIQTGLYIGGGALLVGSVISFIRNDGISTTELILGGLGAASFSVAYLISLDKPKHLRNAINIYNNF